MNAAVGKLGQENPPVGFTSYSDRRDNEDEGWACRWPMTWCRPTGSSSRVLSLAKSARHPHAARLMIDFMMGDDSDTGGDAFKPFYVAGDYATRVRHVPHPDAVPLAEFKAWAIDPARTARHGPRWAI